MSYLSPEYRHDIFFSYPHADADNRGGSELKAWSQTFAEDLRRLLISSRKHQDLSFFLDQGQREGERLDEAATPNRALKEAADAALLVALMSPWYLESRWCKEEREAWALGSGGDAGRVAKSFQRAFVMRVQDTGQDPWPPEFSDAKSEENLGFWLYDRAEPFASPFGSIGDAEDIGIYKRNLQKIKQRLLQRLDEMHGKLKEERDKRENFLRLTGQGTQLTAVYVHARPTAKAAFDQTWEQLSETRFYPIPTEPEPLRPDGRLTDRERERLQIADALLVLGTDANDLEIDMAVVGRHARSLCMAEAPKLLPGAVLDKIGAPSPRNRLQSSASIVGLRWLDGRNRGWTETLREHLVRAATAELVGASVGASA
jgi:hypothetical protein